MKINKFKIISVAICCLVTALWPQVQCMENPYENNDEHIRNNQTRVIPTGVVTAYAGEVAPHGWLLCDGGRYSNQRYPELYEVIKTKYVPHNSWVIEANRHSELEKFFCVPDFRGRVIVGVDSGAGRITSNNTLGASGGEENVTLITNNLPEHDHIVKCSPQTQLGGNYSGDILVPHGSPRATQNRHTASAGGGQPHNNMQPYLVLNYIINTGEMNRRGDSLSANTGIIEQLQRQISELNISVANLSVNIMDSIIPIGTIIEYSGNARIPDNLLECNGAAVSRVNYAALFANIGVTYGSGNDVNTFNLPDRRGRVAVGIGSDGSTGGHVTNSTAPNIRLGGTFGEERHLLDIGEMPEHDHTFPYRDNNPDISGFGMQNSQPYQIGDYRTSRAGGNQPHNNMQPSILMRFYIRAK